MCVWNIKGTRFLFQFSNKITAVVLHCRSPSSFHIYRKYLERKFRHGLRTHSTNSFSLTSYLINHCFHTQEGDKFECNATRKTIKRIDSRAAGRNAISVLSHPVYRISAFLPSRGAPPTPPPPPHRVCTVRGTYCGSCHLYLPNPIFRFVPRWRPPAFSAISRGTRKQARRCASRNAAAADDAARDAQHTHRHTYARTLGVEITDWI